MKKTTFILLILTSLLYTFSTFSEEYTSKVSAFMNTLLKLDDLESALADEQLLALLNETPQEELIAIIDTITKEYLEQIQTTMKLPYIRSSDSTIESYASIIKQLSCIRQINHLLLLKLTLLTMKSSEHVSSQE